MDEGIGVQEKSGDMMMDKADEDDDDVETEKISEAFICCICRDLLYKPVVLACGHISCFWCVNKSMSGLYKSRCPICRNQYFHFPCICQKLHLLLLKLYPCAYKRREEQTLEEEKETGYFSPQINGPVHQLQQKKTETKPSDASLPCLPDADPSQKPCVLMAEKPLRSKGHIQFGSVQQELVLAALDHLKDSAVTSVSLPKDRNSNQTQSNEPCKLVEIDDVLCESCKRMLFRPTILNCGHVFCSCCIVINKDEVLKCQVCETPHPGDIPKVCLEFDHFLEEQFPEEYGLRSSTSLMKQDKSNHEASKTSASKRGLQISFSSGEDPLPWWNANSKVHIGVGCDSCGMYPMIGDRYHCKDCPDKIGYDLCKDCYTTSSKLPGRFNQQHTSEHRFDIMTANEMHELMFGLLSGQLREAPLLPNDSESVDSPSSNTNEGAENVAAAPFPPSEAESDSQNE
ncbi:E3 ubiquitin-protein ligase PRT1 [Andrographis paniculata]|uniref:E3 ubiquitin-protein ligase PRT1 n=1 Tax=Andrographis paniculata TaxID=175694 RepID=UPI0021E8BB6C|nr:E3 ubiquitin-protein ligase PRT1 [Andrographis paniculata]